MLTLENLIVEQGEFRLTASFQVHPGERIAIIGPSGAGKSTLLSVIGGYVAPTSGRILWRDMDLTRIAPGDRPVTTIFQDTNLFPHLTVEQNVGLGLAASLRLTDADHAAVRQALDEVGLSGFGGRKPRALSGGQQSRVALARALLRDKPVLLLDEPFSALGPALKDEMLALLSEVLDRSGAAVLMVSHDPEDARRIADKTVLVADGVAQSPVWTQALLDNPPEALRRYLGSGAGSPG